MRPYPDFLRNSLRNWDLLGILLLVRLVNNKKSRIFHLKKFFFYPDSFGKNVIGRLQLYLPFFNNNQYKSSIERAF